MVKTYLQAAKVQPWPFSPISVIEDPSPRADFCVHDDSCSSRVSFFRRALVGWVGSEDAIQPTIEKLKAWVQLHWNAIGGTVIRYLNSSTFCFIFSSEKEATRIFKQKSWFVHGVPLWLDVWHPLGCSSKSRRSPRFRWIRVVGIPLHLWGDEVFKAIGDRCGGVMHIDEDTQAGEELRWARIKVKGVCRLPEVVSMQAGGWVFELTIWVEATSFCYFGDDYATHGRGKMLSRAGCSGVGTTVPAARGPVSVSIGNSHSGSSNKVLTSFSPLRADTHVRGARAGSGVSGRSRSVQMGIGSRPMGGGIDVGAVAAGAVGAEHGGEASRGMASRCRMEISGRQVTSSLVQADTFLGQKRTVV